MLNGFYRLAADAIWTRAESSTSSSATRRSGCSSPGSLAPTTPPGPSRPAGAILKRPPAPAPRGGTIPVGAGVHTGVAYVGSLGSSEQISDFTALGDAVNTTARLASLAARVSSWCRPRRRTTRDWTPRSLERRTVEVRGREATLDVYAIGTGAATPESSRRPGPRPASRGTRRRRSPRRASSSACGSAAAANPWTIARLSPSEAKSRSRCRRSAPGRTSPAAPQMWTETRSVAGSRPISSQRAAMTGSAASTSAGRQRVEVELVGEPGGQAPRDLRARCRRRGSGSAAAWRPFGSWMASVTRA